MYNSLFSPIIDIVTTYLQKVCSFPSMFRCLTYILVRMGARSLAPPENIENVIVWGAEGLKDW